MSTGLGYPEVPFAPLMNVIGGHTVCTAIGLTALDWIGPQPWALALAVSCSIAVMMATRTVHSVSGSLGMGATGIPAAERVCEIRRQIIRHQAPRAGSVVCRGDSFIHKPSLARRQGVVSPSKRIMRVILPDVLPRSRSSCNGFAASISSHDFRSP